MPIALIVYAILVLTMVSLPLVRSDYWVFRSMEYPRLQKWVLAGIGIIACLVWGDYSSWLFRAGLGAFALSFSFLSYQIYPYLPLAKREVLEDGVSEEANEGQRLSLMIANVYQPNRKAERVLDLAEKLSPDIVLLLETNNWWKTQLQPLEEAYPYTVLVPRENTYGMLLYSKVKLKNPQVHYLIEPDVPSIECLMLLSSGHKVHFFGVHPRPPAPSESVTSTEKDRELLIVAKRAKASQQPVIVAGDLNDVAWSYTTELFQKMSRLLDPRKGRGFFNTFPVKWPVMRFPLDHIFCSRHFKLRQLRRLKSIGSDHFPVFIEFQLYQEIVQPEKAPEPEEKDLAAANAKFQE